MSFLSLALKKIDYEHLTYLSILSVFTISCQDRQKLKLDETIPEQTALVSFPDDKDYVEEIPRPIHQATTKQLIGAMVPDEVLCVAMTSENFKDLGLDFNQFLVVLHEGNQENFLKNIFWIIERSNLYIDMMNYISLKVLCNRASIINQ